ncbi:hypothetical protein CGJ64_22280 [Vibrio parahaemolyticus]|nr:hypothetical protein CGJ64_22280 [Vibrio parahaemolyticus]
MFMAQWSRLGGGVVHPLMRRYANYLHFQPEENFNEVVDPIKVPSVQSRLLYLFILSVDWWFDLSFQL